MNLNKYRVCQASAYPENLQLEVSRSCALGCLQCRRTLYGRESKGTISPAVIEKMDPVFAQADMVGINGWGESFTTDMVWRVLDVARWNHTNPCVTTNGMLMNDAICRKLVEQQMGQVTVSLDAGTPEGYRRLRPGVDLEVVLANIRRLAAIRDAMGTRTPYIAVTFNFREESAEEFPHYVRLAAALPVIKAAVHPHFPPEVDNTSRDHRLSERARECYEEGTALAKQLGVRLEVRLEPVLDHQLGRSNPESEGKVYLPTLDEVRERQLFPTCRCAWDFPFIDVEGNVYPCSIYPEPLGNLMQSSFEEVWDGERFIQFRRNMLTQRPSFFCLFCRKTMWFYNHLNEPVPEHLPLGTEGLVGLGWYPPEKLHQGVFRWSRGVATVFIRNSGKPRLYLVGQALRETRVQVAVDGRPVGPLPVRPFWDVSSIALPPSNHDILRVSFTCPDAQDDPASGSPWCRMRLLGIAASQVGTCQSEEDEEPRRALRQVQPGAAIGMIKDNLGKLARNLLVGL